MNKFYRVEDLALKTRELSPAVGRCGLHKSCRLDGASHEYPGVAVLHVHSEALFCKKEIPYARTYSLVDVGSILVPNDNMCPSTQIHDVLEEQEHARNHLRHTIVPSVLTRFVRPNTRTFAHCHNEGEKPAEGIHPKSLTGIFDIGLLQKHINHPLGTHAINRMPVPIQ